MYGRAEFVEAGGLMAYAVTLDSLYARSATLVARLLEGAAVADVPWELPPSYDFVLNRKTADALGLSVPQSILPQINRLIG